MSDLLKVLRSLTTLSIATSTRAGTSEQRLPKKELEKSIGTATEGRTQEVDAIPAALFEYALGVAEPAEALDSVVRAYAAGTDAAKGKIVICDVRYRCVDGDIAGHGAAQYPCADLHCRHRNNGAPD